MISHPGRLLIILGKSFLKYPPPVGQDLGYGDDIWIPILSARLLKGKKVVGAALVDQIPNNLLSLLAIQKEN